MRSLLRRIFRRPGPDTPETMPRRARIAITPVRKQIYAVGDIHGCYTALLALEARIREDVSATKAERPLIVYLGDYVDRGPASEAVLQHLSGAGHPDGIERIALCGNHDDAFLRFLKRPAENIAWLDFGGDATLRSYGLGHLANSRRRRDFLNIAALLEETIPARHIRFLEQLPLLAFHDAQLFVHAGIRPGVALEEQTEEDLLWIREPFLAEGPNLPLTVIHGHTANVEPVVARGRICVDTGCYATGRLTAVKLTETGAVFF